MELQPPSAEPQALAEASPTEASRQLPIAAPQLLQQLPPAQQVHEHAPVQPSPLSTVPPITPGAPDDGSFEPDSAAEGDAPSTPNAAAFRSPMPARGGRGRGRDPTVQFIFEGYILTILGRGGSRGGRGRRKSSGIPLKEDSIVNIHETAIFKLGVTWANPISQG